MESFDWLDVTVIPATENLIPPSSGSICILVNIWIDTQGKIKVCFKLLLPVPEESCLVKPVLIKIVALNEYLLKQVLVVHIEILQLIHVLFQVVYMLRVIHAIRESMRLAVVPT